MSLSSPGDYIIPQDLTRENVGEYKRGIGFFAPGQEKILDLVLRSKTGGIYRFVKPWGRVNRIYHFLTPYMGHSIKKAPFSSHRISTEHNQHPGKIKWMLSCTAKVMR